MDFPLETEAVEFRGRTFTIREVTAGEKAEWSKRVTKVGGQAGLIELTAIALTDPKLTVEELTRAPAALVEQLGEVCMRLSGFDPDKPEGDEGKA